MDIHIYILKVKKAISDLSCVKGSNYKDFLEEPTRVKV